MGLTEAEELELLELEEAEYQASKTKPNISSGPSEFESAARGLAQGASFGFADEISGRVESLFSDKTYEQARDESRKNFKQAKETNPMSYGAGEIGGSLATALIPGAAPASFGKLALRGALEGAVYGLGSTDADNLKDAAIDTGIGALGGTGGAALVKGLNSVASAASPIIQAGANKVGSRLEDFAERKAAKALGAGAKEFQNPEMAKALGRNALDNNILGPYVSAEESLARATAGKEKAGAAMSDVYRAVDEKIGPSFNPLNTAVRVEQELAPVYRTPINRSEVGQLENTIESILARGDSSLPLGEAQLLKKEIDAVAFPKGKRPKDPTPKQQMAADASRIIREEIDVLATKGAEATGDTQLLQDLANARSSYGLNKQSEKLLTQRVGKEGAGVGRKINWTIDPIAFGSSVAKKFAPDYSTSAAIGADKISDVLRQSPQAFGKYSKVLMDAARRGANATSATHYILQSTDPNYRQTISNIFGGDDETNTQAD